MKAETVKKNVEKALSNTFGGLLKRAEVNVKSEGGGFLIEVVFETSEGEVKAGGEVRKAKAGEHKLEAKVTLEEGDKFDEVRFEGKCGESTLIDTYYVEKRKLSEVPSWIGDKVATLALNCSTEIAEQADVGGLFGW